MESRPEDVLSFWFGEPAGDVASMGAKFKRWFGGGAELDREIRERFGATVERALAGALDPWAESARGRLALIVALDQFITPLAHAEDLVLQERSVTEAERLLDDVPEWQRSFFSKGLEMRRKYRDVITRFGRFPHRNVVHGRASTAEEQAFLDALEGGARA